MSQFDKFAAEEKRKNPAISDEELEKKWSERPLAKRLASGIESGVEGIGTAVKSPFTLASAVNEKYKETIGPDTKLGKALRPQYSVIAKKESTPASTSTGFVHDEKKAGSVNDAVSGFESIESPEPTSGIGPFKNTEAYGNALSDSKFVAQKAPEQANKTATPAPQVEKINATAEAIDKYSTDPAIKERLGAIQGLMEKAQSEYEANRNRAEWGQVIEKLGNAVALIGAGAYGMKNGVDATSGLKFSQSDWEAKIDRHLKELQHKQGQLSKESEQLMTLDEKARAAHERKQETLQEQEFRQKEAQKDRDLRKSLADKDAAASTLAERKALAAGLYKDAESIEQQAANLQKSLVSGKASQIAGALRTAGVTPDDSGFNVFGPNEGEINAKLLGEQITKLRKDATSKRQQAQGYFGAGQESKAPATSTQPAAAPKAVRMMDPKTGEVAEVAPDKVQKYLDKGMKVVK